MSISALVVGVNNSVASSYLPSLRHAESTAFSMLGNLQLYTPDIATQGFIGSFANTQRLKQEILRLTEEAPKNNLLLFYFIGYALAAQAEGDNDIYLVTHDFNEFEAQQGTQSHLSMRWLRKTLIEGTRTDGVLLILDCVYAGGMGSSVDPSSNVHGNIDDFKGLVDRIFKGTYIRQLPDTPRVILASGNNERTEDGYFLLTNTIEAALRGQVPTVQRGDREIDLGALLEYVEVSVPESLLMLSGRLSQLSRLRRILSQDPTDPFQLDAIDTTANAQPDTPQLSSAENEQMQVLTQVPPDPSTSLQSDSQETSDSNKLQKPQELVEIAIRALADTPSDVDLLDFEDYANALVDFIKSEKTQKPLTIAIDAAWGMGKTTLMGMIKSKLESEGYQEQPQSPVRGDQHKQRNQKKPTKSSFPIVWFNAWQYDQEGSLWAALALEILDQVGKQSTIIRKASFRWQLTQRRLGKRNLFLGIAFRSLPFIAVFVALVAVLFAIALLWQGNALIESTKTILLSIAGTLGGLALIYASVKKAFMQFIKPLDQKVAQYIREPNYKDRIGFLAEFKEDFSFIVEAVTGQGKWPLIIFIDDLDRCAPPKPVEIIEAINLLLDAQYCVFVMGMDTQTVAGSIEAKYKDLLSYLDATAVQGELTLGQRFLEKIIQITFHLPRADSLVVQEFIDTILESSDKKLMAPPSDIQVQEAEQLIEAERRTGKELDAAADTVRQDRVDLPENVIVKAKEEIRAKSFDDSKVVQQAIRDAAPFLELNPRKIKRFINMFRLQALIANRRGLLDNGAIKLDVLAKWIVISSRWPIVVDALLTDERFINRLKEARKILEEIRRVRLTIEPGKNFEDEEKLHQTKLETYTIDPHIKLLVDATDLVHLLNQLSDGEIQALPIYLHLTQITSQTIGI